jgi:hypothetical protein
MAYLSFDIVKLEYFPLEREEVKRILRTTNLKIVWKVGKCIPFKELNLENFRKIRGEYYLIGKWFDTKEKQEFVGSLLIVSLKYKNKYVCLTESNKKLQALLIKKLLSNNLAKIELIIYRNEPSLIVGLVI